MIRLNQLSLQFGSRQILDAAIAVIGNKDRIGLVGPNGAGKTTLLRLLAGEIEADRGAIEQAGYVTVGYLPQDGVEGSERSLFDEALSAFTEIQQLRAETHAIEQSLKTLDAQTAAYAEALQRLTQIDEHLERADASRVHGYVERVLKGLGFKPADFQQPTRTFSGGWLMRAALAKLLLREPALLILDEPTNHLDVTSQFWLEKYLTDYKGAVLLVSHDRAFLDTVCQRIFALDSGDLLSYEGNYSYYEEQELLRYERLVKEKAAQERKLAKEEAFIERFRYKASKARQVQSRIKALDKVERIEIKQDAASIHFTFPPAPPCGRVVLQVEGLSKQYGEKRVLDRIDFLLEKKQKVAVVGENGAGKSTLVRILAGVESYDEGKISTGEEVKIGWFAQHQADSLNKQWTVLESVEEVGIGMGETYLRSLLGSFLFRGDSVYKSVSVLSGGERNRLALARILLQPANCLILDEPTNHLDMDSKEILQEALSQYDGALLLVSHDRAFLDPIVSHVVEVAHGNLTVYPGNLTDYYAHLSELERAQPQATSRTSTAPVVEPTTTSADQRRLRRQRVAELNQQLAPLRRQVKALESQIMEWEEEQAAYEQKMGDSEFYHRGEAVQQEMKLYADLQRKIEEGYQKWEDLAAEMERLEAQK